VPKPKIIFQCRECGGVQTRWMGKCPDCGAWDALEQGVQDVAAERDPQMGVAGAGISPQAIAAAWADTQPGPHGETADSVISPANPARSLSEIGPAQHAPRLTSGIGELAACWGGDWSMGA
jgi:predicted ATP-dependent serine protease